MGEVAAEHEQGRAHSPVASARPEVERGAPATCAAAHTAAAPMAGLLLRSPARPRIAGRRGEGGGGGGTFS